VYLKIFGQNRIQELKVLHSRQFMEVENNVKIMKRKENHSVYRPCLHRFLDPIFQSLATSPPDCVIGHRTFLENSFLGCDVADLYYRASAHNRI
jgi:hypothetical protein